MLAGELRPDGGTIEVGHGVELGYFAQHHAEVLDRAQTAYEAVAAVAPSASDTKVRSVLGAFLFGDDDIDKKISVLSGGERARVALARLLMAPGNVMLMDEPTNHLDLASAEALAEALQAYEGTVLFVSHNRSFVRRLATRIVDVAKGRLEVYPGTLDEYLERCRRLGGVDPDAPTPMATTVASSAAGRPRGAAPPMEKDVRPPRGDGRRERRERAERRAEVARTLGPLRQRVRELEVEIAAVEGAQKSRSASLSDPATYEDAGRRTELMTSYRREAERLGELTARWELALAELEDAEAACAED
jgi:ATP-binding cassette subfamily F protein 3